MANTRGGTSPSRRPIGSISRPTAGSSREQPYHPIREVWKQHGGAVDLRTAALIVAINKVAVSYEQLGIFP